MPISGKPEIGGSRLRMTGQTLVPLVSGGRNDSMSIRPDQFRSRRARSLTQGVQMRRREFISLFGEAAASRAPLRQIRKNIA
jgi:hypothetical protein